MFKQQLGVFNRFVRCGGEGCKDLGGEVAEFVGRDAGESFDGGRDGGGVEFCGLEGGYEGVGEGEGFAELGLVGVAEGGVY